MSKTEPNYFLTFRFRELKFSAIFSYVSYQRIQILKTTHHVAISSIISGTDDHILNPKVNE